MDARDQLLLSDGVCHQLDIVTYHPEVQQWRKWQTRWQEAQVPTVRVKLVKTIDCHQATVQLWMLNSASINTERPLLSEDCTLGTESVVSGSLLRTTETGLAQLVISNTSGWTEVIQEGKELGVATCVSVINPRLERDSRANKQLMASPKAEHFAVEDSSGW